MIISLSRLIIVILLYPTFLSDPTEKPLFDKSPQVVRNPSDDLYIKAFLDSYEFVFMPVLNPDGKSFYTGDSLILLIGEILSRLVLFS